MLTATLSRRPQSLATQRRLPQPLPWQPDDESNFGAFGRLRQTIAVLKPDAITMLAAYWATGGRTALNGNDIFGKAKTEHPGWFDTLNVIEAFDRSLMLPATRLVMSMVRDPHQIPDSPPPAAMQRFLQGIQQHPDATIWYAEPVFALNPTPDSLPVPVSDEAFLRESGDRVLQAQRFKNAFGWFYRGHAKAGQLLLRLEKYFHDRKLQRERLRAEAARESAEAKMQSLTTGRIVGRRSANQELAEIRELEARYEQVAREFPELELMGYRALTPVRMQMFRFDPLLFLELPGEQKLLRLVAHWFWQTQGAGQPRKLHLHL